MPTPRPDTAFPGTMRALADAVGAAPVDAASLARPLARCALAACRGTCCTEGVVLNAEEAAVVRALLRRRGDALRALHPALPDVPLVEETGADGGRVVRSALVPRRYHGVVDGYPPHFRDAACAFLTDDARCALQLLGEAEGRHAWHYKPLACWLHPIAVSPDAIALPSPASDRYAEGAAGGFASATFCGRTRPEGAPAADVLAPELAHLGALLGRDLVAEARGAAREPSAAPGGGRSPGDGAP